MKTLRRFPLLLVLAGFVAACVLDVGCPAVATLLDGPELAEGE